MELILVLFAIAGILTFAYVKVKKQQAK